MLREFRSAEFQQAETYVLSRLPFEHEPDQGVSGLPDDVRLQVVTVSSFASSVGSLVLFEMVHEKLPVGILGYRLNRLWTVLEPYIRRERELRGAEYMHCFEHLCTRYRRRGPRPLESYGLLGPEGGPPPSALQRAWRPVTIVVAKFSSGVRAGVARRVTQ